jgi:hypothetical protein
MYNNALNALIDGCFSQVRETPLVVAARDKADALLREIAEGVHSCSKLKSLAGDLDEAGYGHMLAVAEAMFIAGWKLRGNPDTIFDLPDAN